MLLPSLSPPARGPLGLHLAASSGMKPTRDLLSRYSCWWLRSRYLPVLALMWGTRVAAEPLVWANEVGQKLALVQSLL